MNEKNYSKVPVFENGLAQPVFPLTDGKTGEKYDPATSSIVRYCVYVETDYDVDGDGKRDLVKAVVQVPRSAVEGNYKAATLYEARPYAAGVQEDGYPHMKENIIRLILQILTKKWMRMFRRDVSVQWIFL